MHRPSFAFLAPLLTRLGTRAGFNAHRLAKQSVIVTASHAIGILKGIITVYLVTRLFPPALYGEYKFAGSIVGTVGCIAIPGIIATLSTQIAQKGSRAPVRSAMKMYAVWCTAGSILIALSILLLPYWQKESLWTLIAVSALLFVPSNVGGSIFSSLTRGTARFDRALTASIVCNLLQVIGVLFVLWIKPSALLLLMCTTGIPSILYAIAVLWWAKEYPSRASFRPYIRQSIALSLASLPSALSWYIDGLLITAHFGLNQLATFSVAIIIPEQMKIWSKELFPILYASQASGEDTWNRRKKITRFVFAGIILSSILILLYCLLTPFIIPILFPQYDAQTITILTNISAMTLVMTPCALYTQYLEARGMISALQWCTWISSGIYVAALCLMVPLYGPLGAILSRGVLRFSLGATSYVALRTIPLKK